MQIHSWGIAIVDTAPARFFASVVPVVMHCPGRAMKARDEEETGAARVPRHVTIGRAKCLFSLGSIALSHGDHPDVERDVGEAG